MARRSQGLSEALLDELEELHDRVTRLELQAGLWERAKNAGKAIVAAGKQALAKQPLTITDILKDLLSKHKITPDMQAGDHVTFTVKDKKIDIDRADDKHFKIKIGDNAEIKFDSLKDMEAHLKSAKAMGSAASAEEIMAYSRMVMQCKGF